MTTYYLMPTSYRKEDGKIKSVICWDLIRKYDRHHSKIGKLARNYEKELNGGKEWTPEAVVAGKTLSSVLAIPYSEARDYRTFDDWPCNQDELDLD